MISEQQIQEEALEIIENRDFALTLRKDMLDKYDAHDPDDRLLHQIEIGSVKEVQDIITYLQALMLETMRGGSSD